MNCAQCGGALKDGAKTCPSCGTGVPPKAVSATGVSPKALNAPPPRRGTARTPATNGTFNFDATRWTQTDKLTGVATAVVLISLFMTWFRFSAPDGPLTVSLGESGLSAHPYLYFVMVLSLVILVYLALGALWEDLPSRVPLHHDRLLLIMSGVNFVFVLVAFVFKPVGGRHYGLLVSVAWTTWSIIGLIAALIAVAPLALPMIQSRRPRR
jgi:hypothetical protein